MDPEPPSSREDFQIGFVCALPLEFDAVVAVLDQVWDEDVCAALGKAPGDGNTYTHGRMKGHNVVVVLLRQRGGKPTMGKANAAIVASDLRHSYFGLRLALLVGICGGIPRAGDKEMLLGDVVIGNSVVQYDFGRQFPDGFRRKQGAQNTLAAPMENGSILGILGTDHGKESVRVKTASFLAALQQKRSKYTFPGAAYDKLYEPHYRHKHQDASRDCKCQHHQKETDVVCDEALEKSCEDLGCNDSFLVKRSRLEERLAATADDDAVFQPAIFVGGVATGDTVMKAGVNRDRVAKVEGIIAFEMEAAGIWEQLPTVIIKAVCDYADSHKNKKWQDYAAGTAAAAAKAVVMFYTPADKQVLRVMKAAQPESILPFPPDPEFISRPEISDWLRDRAKIPGARVALVGLGGIGKSQLAIQYAHGVRSRSHVFWINATTRSTLEESFRAIAERLSLERPGDSLNDMLRRVGSWLGREQNGRWTVVLDNFDDSSILTDDDPRLQKLLPQSSNGFTLITSRTVKAAERLTGSAKNVIYSVSDLGEETAMELFQGKLESPCEKKEAQEVVRLLEFMPLAISQAAAYINSCRVSVQDYAVMFRAGDEKRNALLEWEYDELRRYQGGANSVFGTWTITLEQMQQEKPSAIDLLSLMSFYSPQSIPEWTLKCLYTGANGFYLPEFTVRDIMPSAATSLLSRTGLGRRLLGQTLDNDLQKDMWSLWTEPDMGSKNKKGKDKKDPGTKKSGIPKKEKKKKARWSAMTKLAGRAMRAQPLFQYDPASDTESSDDGEHATNTPAVPTRDEAAEELEQDLGMLRKYSMVTSTAKEGVLKMHPLVRYCTQSWLSQSQALDLWKRRFLKIMSMNSVTPPPGHESHGGDLLGHIEFIVDEKPEDAATARLWYSLCAHLVHYWDERGSQDPAAVLALQEKMAAVGDKILGPGDQLTIISLTCLADHAFGQGEFDKAEAMFKDVLQRAESVHDRYSDIVLECQLRYARTLRALGRLNESEQITGPMVAQLSDLVDIVLNRRTWDDAGYCMANHAETLAALGRFEEATEMTLDLLRKHYLTDPEKPNFEGTMACLPDITKKMSEHSPAEEVEPLLLKIFNLVEKVPEKCRQFAFTVCGPFHQHLAVCFEKQGKVVGAEFVLNRGIELMAKALPLPKLQPPTLAESLLEGPGDDDKETRQRLLQEVIQNLDSEDGRFSVAFLQEMANIGRRLYIQGRVEECWVLLNAMCRHLQTEWGESHTQTKAVMEFRDEMEKWHVERRQKAHELEDRRKRAVPVDGAVDLAQDDSPDGNTPETVAV